MVEFFDDFVYYSFMIDNNKVGITTTIPVEIIYAAGLKPVDLNNIFITDKNPEKFIEKAEIDGFPGNCCSWIKGIYSAVIFENIKKVIAPVWGDCSNTHALSEVLKENDVEVIEFAYPYNRNINSLKNEFHKLYNSFDVSESEVILVWDKLKSVRKKLEKLDNLTVEGKITPLENHIWLVNSSDFNGNIEEFENNLNEFLASVEKRKTLNYKFRLGCIGVPPIFSDFHDYFQSLNTGMIYNEIPLEFSMCKYTGENFYNQYLEYSYPYGMSYRINKIKQEVESRKLDGLIHYTQCFCYRQIEDIILKKHIDIPVLTIEGDRPSNIDARTKLRIENFMELL